MSGESPLRALLARAGTDPDPRARERAYEELVRLLLILVRARLGVRLREQRESMDVCQSLARSFVEDVSAGRVVFESESALVAYLRKAVGSKLADLSRRDTAQRRGGGARGIPLDRATGGDVPSLAARDADAGDAVLEREELDLALDLLDEEEKRLVALRRAGMEWNVIARELATSEEALRQRWSRLQRRVAGALDKP